MKQSQNLCEVNIKKETASEHDGADSTDRLSSSQDGFDNQGHIINNSTNDISHTSPPYTINNIAATLETLNALRSQFMSQNNPPSEIITKKICSDNTSPDVKMFMEMQAKEHTMRMQILEVQLQTAKYNRDIVEINKTVALQKRHDLANRRMH